MDSIIKNLKDTNYVQVFQENIVKTFANVFECVSFLFFFVYLFCSFLFNKFYTRLMNKIVKHYIS
jgi:hypothetical protein